MNDALKSKVKSSTLVCIEDSFPEDNVWQRKKLLNEANTSTNKFLPSEYARSILLYNISPVASSISFLDKDADKKAIGVIIDTILSTLISYILERRIKLRC